ncbi:hypothetical protein N7507_007713 [Penicillium longicatenatum]|nr:hypothetical protein N7507_007713 [Penicillium longicatenatum]
MPLSLIFLALSVCSAALQSRQSPVQTPFSLYGYGNNIDGLSVFYADGKAQLGDMSLSNATEKMSFSVTYGSNPQTWIARPHSTSENAVLVNDGTSSNSSMMGLSQSSALANAVTFIPNNNDLTPGGTSGNLTDVWTLYGSYVLLTPPGANFYAKATERDGWYLLLWSQSVKASLDYIPITLTTNAPLASSS